MGYSIVNGRIVRSGVWKITGGDAMAYLTNRRSDMPEQRGRCGAGFEPASRQAEKNGHPDRTIVIQVGNTRSRLTPDEAADLAAQMAAAVKTAKANTMAAAG